MIPKDFSKNVPNGEYIPKNFLPKMIESHWSSVWEGEGLFKKKRDSIPEKSVRQPCFIQFPPPNITGFLHMGHALNQTIMDSLARYHRMSGKDVMFLPGTDHAGIATQLIVERKMDIEKVSRYELGREKFLEKVWSWKAQSGNTIAKQIRRLGSSVDWSNEYFTMDKQTSEGVIEAFLKLYEQGLIYRGTRLVNWDSKLLSAISDLEVQFEEKTGEMVHILYPFSENCAVISDKTDQKKENLFNGIIVATTRPETIFADSAICVNPEDARYRKLIGKMVKIPLCGREIPIIADDFVDPKFATGCVKITGAHDFNDYDCSLRHHLPMITILSKSGHINENAPKQFQGLKWDEARARTIEELRKVKCLIKIQEHKKVEPRGDRSGAIIQPMLTNQWFLNMNKPAPQGTINAGMSISEMAIKAAESGLIEFYPENWKNVYKNWLSNIKDWCISRQLWWGHRIPAWYTNNGKIIVARNEAEALKKAQNIELSESVLQDEDVLDTWFSSSLIPLTTLGWPNETVALKHYLSSGFLVSGFDIIFFWVARMIMMSIHFTGKIPFKKIYVHGLIRDSHGQKMSKSKGNTLDPIDLIDGIDLENLVHKRIINLPDPKETKNIERQTREEYPNGIPGFGTDALRLTMASYSSPGININFDFNRCQNYRNFCNKLWNASRFILMNAYKLGITEIIDIGEKTEISFIDRWIYSKLEILKSKLSNNFLDCRLDNIVEALYHFMWHDYCDWYLEFAKVKIKKGSNQEKIISISVLIEVLESFLRLAHPIIPFITEELWQKVSPFIIKKTGLSPAIPVTITSQIYPSYNPKLVDIPAETSVLDLKKQIEAVRALCSSMGLQKSEMKNISLIASSSDMSILQRNAPYILSMAQVDQIDILSILPNIDAPIQIVGNTSFMLNIQADSSRAYTRLRKEISDLQNQIEKSQKKLQNSDFIKKAPEHIVNQEKEKLKNSIDAFQKITEQYKKLQLIERNRDVNSGI